MQKLLALPLALMLFASCGDETSPAEKKDLPAAADSPAAKAKSVAIDSASADSLQPFGWAQGACTYDGIYNNRKYSKEQIEGTHAVCFESWYLIADATVFKPEEMGSLNLAELEKEYREKKEALASKQLVPGPYWEKQKKLCQRELEESYAIKKLTIQAYSNPKLLLNSPYTAACGDYAKALASGDEEQMMAAWKKLLVRQKEKNGYPESLQEEFDKQSKSPERLLHAKYQLMTYGWWNCANHQVTHIVVDQAMMRAFEKLFVSVKEECDGP